MLSILTQFYMWFLICSNNSEQRPLPVFTDTATVAMYSDEQTKLIEIYARTTRKPMGLTNSRIQPGHSGLMPLLP